MVEFLGKPKKPTGKLHHYQVGKYLFGWRMAKDPADPRWAVLSKDGTTLTRYLLSIHQVEREVDSVRFKGFRLIILRWVFFGIVGVPG